MSEAMVSKEGAGAPGFLPLVDAHVHIYGCFQPTEVLDSAAANFKRAAVSWPQDGPSAGMLLLSESAGHHWFAEQAAAGGAELGGWRLSLLAEESVTLAARRGDEMLYIVAGRQLVSEEGLEVLALMSSAQLPDGLPLRRLLEEVAAAGAVAVIPWAVGKWLGRRGRLLTALLEDAAAPAFYLGDNGGRPLFWRNPGHFRRAARAGIPVLPGSDPLPLPGEATRVGSYGFALPGLRLDARRPADSLRRGLHQGAMVRPYGALEKPLRFFRKQLALRRRAGGMA